MPITEKVFGALGVALPALITRLSDGARAQEGPCTASGQEEGPPLTSLLALFRGHRPTVVTRPSTRPRGSSPRV